LGGMASHELFSLYYPTTSRPVRRLADDVLPGLAGRAESNLLMSSFCATSSTCPKSQRGSLSGFCAMERGVFDCGGRLDFNGKRRTGRLHAG